MKIKYGNGFMTINSQLGYCCLQFQILRVQTALICAWFFFFDLLYICIPVLETAHEEDALWGSMKEAGTDKWEEE